MAILGSLPLLTLPAFRVVLGPGISKSANPYYVRRALNAELVQRDLSHLFSGASDAICPHRNFCR
jgi:hypothetical protein